MYSTTALRRRGEVEPYSVGNVVNSPGSVENLNVLSCHEPSRDWLQDFATVV